MRLLPIKPSHTSLGRALVLPEKDFSFLHLRLLVKAKLFSSIAIFLARRKVGQNQTCPLRGFGAGGRAALPFQCEGRGRAEPSAGLALPCAPSLGSQHRRCGERN